MKVQKYKVSSRVLNMLNMCEMLEVLVEVEELQDVEVKDVLRAIRVIRDGIPSEGATVEDISSVIVRSQSPEDPLEWIDRFIRLGWLEERKGDDVGVERLS